MIFSRENTSTANSYEQSITNNGKEKWSMALEAMSEQNYEEAYAIFETMQADIFVLFNQALAAHALKKYEDCIHILSYLIELDEENFMYCFVLADILFRMHRYIDSDRLYEKCLGMFSGSHVMHVDEFGLECSIYESEVLLNRAICLNKIGDLEESEELLIQAYVSATTESQKETLKKLASNGIADFQPIFLDAGVYYGREEIDEMWMQPSSSSENPPFSFTDCGSDTPSLSPLNRENTAIPEPCGNSSSDEGLYYPSTPNSTDGDAPRKLSDSSSTNKQMNKKLPPNPSLTIETSMDKNVRQKGNHATTRSEMENRESVSSQLRISKRTTSRVILKGLFKNPIGDHKREESIEFPVWNKCFRERRFNPRWCVLVKSALSVYDNKEKKRKLYSIDLKKSDMKPDLKEPELSDQLPQESVGIITLHVNKKHIETQHSFVKYYNDKNNPISFAILRLEPIRKILDALSTSKTTKTALEKLIIMENLNGMRSDERASISPSRLKPRTYSMYYSSLN